MNINPLVSIIIPTYNRAHFINETLDSIMAQTYSNWECIIVDDGSTDNSEFVIAKYVELDSRFQYYHRPADRIKGANSCRNYGFELSKGEYINWFDSDDIMFENFIYDKIKSFQRHTDFVICSGYYWCPENGERSIMDLSVKTNLFKDYALWKLEIITNSILFKKKFLIGKSLFLNKIKRGQETEFFSRLFYKVNPSNYVIINKPLFLYRQHSESKTFKNNYYVHSYKESQTFIAIANLRRSIEIGDG
jgi:glycosyltransferase involved in cell wall biosynthesis